MPSNRYLAECLGAFALTFVVWLSVMYAMPIPTPIIAAMTLGVFVYTVGDISGAHLNPAITLAMLSIRKISARDAMFYIIAQLIGAVIAMLIGFLLSNEDIITNPAIKEGIVEGMGTFFLAFAVTGVTVNKIDSAMTGFAVGLSLFIGIYIAIPFSDAILNPAVALGTGSFSPMYILGPIVGAVAGAWTYQSLRPVKGGTKPSAVRTK